MVWRTNWGDRTLEGAEADFYLIATHIAIERIEALRELCEEFDWGTGNRLFDTASFEKKVAIIHFCLSALLRPDVSPPQLTHVLEAAAYFPFASLKLSIEDEILLSQEGFFEGRKKPYEFYYRQILWQAFLNLVKAELESVPEKDFEAEEDIDIPEFNEFSQDLEQWETIIESFLERVFWDRDWMISTKFPQLLDGIEPEFTAATGIDEGYMTNRLPAGIQIDVNLALSQIKNWPRIKADM